jgi:hypothetical protein
MPYIYSGFCLAAMFGSIIYEHHLIKKEERELRDRMILLAQETRNSFGLNQRDLNPDYVMKPVVEA